MSTLEALLAAMGMGQEVQALSPTSVMGLGTKKKGPLDKPSAATKATLRSKTTQQIAPESAQDVSTGGQIPAALTPVEKEQERIAENYRKALSSPGGGAGMQSGYKITQTNILTPDEAANLASLAGPLRDIATGPENLLTQRALEAQNRDQREQLVSEIGKEQSKLIQDPNAVAHFLYQLGGKRDKALGSYNGSSSDDKIKELRTRLNSFIEEANKTQDEKFKQGFEMQKMRVQPPSVFSGGYTIPTPKAAAKGISSGMAKAGGDAYSRYLESQKMRSRLNDIIPSIQNLSSADKAILGSPAFWQAGYDASKGSENIRKLNQFVSKVISTYGYDVSGKVISVPEMERLKTIIGSGATQSPGQLRSGLEDIIGSMNNKAAATWGAIPEDDRNAIIKGYNQVKIPAGEPTKAPVQGDALGNILGRVKRGK